MTLDPGGFWSRPGAYYLGATIWPPVRLLRLVRPALPALTTNTLARSVLLLQLCGHPWRVVPQTALSELHSFAATSVFDEVLRDLISGPPQPGIHTGSTPPPVVIASGRRDRLTPPRQAR